MRIGCVGTHGSGKTTFCNTFIEKYPKFKLTPSTARKMQKIGFKINRDADPFSQIMVMLSRTTTEDKLYNEHGLVISDRTPIDSLAYTLYQLNVWDANDILEEYMNICCLYTAEHMKKYDGVLYFPPYWKPKDDGVRDSSLEYQLSVDTLIKECLKQLNIDFFTMPNLNNEKRLAAVEVYLTGKTI